MGDWEYAALQGGSFNPEIYRFSGNARDRDEVLRWSMILKIIRSPEGKNEPAGKIISLPFSTNRRRGSTIRVFRQHLEDSCQD